MRRLLLISCSLFGACSGIQPMPSDQPCREAGYAIAARTFACTEDAELSNGRYKRFEADYVCVPIDLNEAPDNPANFPEDDYFHCAYAIDGLSCEEVLRRGDDLDASDHDDGLADVDGAGAVRERVAAAGEHRRVAPRHDRLPCADGEELNHVQLGKWCFRNETQAGQGRAAKLY